jgi:hypothetical protein
LNKFGPFFLTAGLALVAPLGCNRDRVESARIEKAAPAVNPSMDPAALPPGHPPMTAPTTAPGTAMPAGQVPPPPKPQGGQALQWVLPKGWTPGEAGGMRYATLKPSGKAEVSVVMLSGPAGGELANVNRWRSQLGLPPIEEAALTRKVVKSKAGTVAVFEFANAGNRMVVGLLSTTNGNTWFLKLMGEDAAVSQALPGFLQLLGTLNLG